jgi:hypothetical protein
LFLPIIAYILSSTKLEIRNSKIIRVSAGYQGGGGEREGLGWVVREGVGAVGEMTQVLYAHMNNKKK